MSLVARYNNRGSSFEALGEINNDKLSLFSNWLHQQWIESHSHYRNLKIILFKGPFINTEALLMFCDILVLHGHGTSEIELNIGTDIEFWSKDLRGLQTLLQNKFFDITISAEKVSLLTAAQLLIEPLCYMTSPSYLNIRVKKAASCENALEVARLFWARGMSIMRGRAWSNTYEWSQKFNNLVNHLYRDPVRAKMVDNLVALCSPSESGYENLIRLPWYLIQMVWFMLIKE